MADHVDGSDNTCEMLIEQGMAAHQAMMTESRGNSAGAHSIVRFSGARKFNREDPMEAAAAEMALSGSPNPDISGPSPRPE